VDTSYDRLGPLSLLAGTWTGRGRGTYPTVAGFEYVEEVSFLDGGTKPFLSYSQVTRPVGGDRLLHVESGYLRWAGAEAEMVVVQPTGLAEASKCHVRVLPDATEFSFRSTSVVATPLAKRVDEVVRILRVRGDSLEYQLDMAAVGLPLQAHLVGTLRRIG
jgi:hypothetical protein